MEIMDPKRKQEGLTMQADYHVHCEFSDDSVYPMEDVVTDAIGLGLEELCFTDHVDYGIKVDWDSGQEIVWRNGEPMANVDYPRYFAKIADMQEKYGDRIRIRRGLELGVQSHTIPQFEALTKKYPLDFAILSIHQVGDEEFWNGEFLQGRTRREFNEAYYRKMLRVVQSFKNYSVLGHMDLIARYAPEGGDPFDEVKDLIEEILKVVIADGKGIEVNTSSVRYGLSDWQPSTKILELYRDLGGRIITIGSDSHKPAHLAAHISAAKEMLKGLGFQEFCMFDKGDPVFHPL